MKDDFLWLQQWFQAHCNKDWEQSHKIHLGTIDNPGWSLTVDLEDTELEDKNFQKVKVDRSEQDWIFCTIRDTKKFDSGGGAENLPEILKIFRYWAENEPFGFVLEYTKIKEESMEEDDFLWLQQWYQDYCNGDWEHACRIHFRTIDNPGWSLTINVDDTDLEYASFQQLKLNRSEQDWIFCEIKDLKFEARCGIENLPEVLKIFRHWATENELSENNEYTWNDYVIVKQDAPEQFHPGEIGVVCGMSEIKFEEIAKEFHAELGEWTYTIEFGDGSDIQVAGRFLEKYPEV